jgi:deoxyribonuclease-4
MPLLGAHLSIAGGFHKALLAAQTYGMDTVQVFTGSPHSWPVERRAEGQAISRSGKASAEPSSPWKAKELSGEEIQTFRRTLRRTKLRRPLAHDCYLVNLASPDAELYRRSVEAFVVELQRAEALGLSYLVAHPGAATDGDEQAGLARVAAALDEVHGRCPGFRVRVLLETTAGQGTCLGHRFEHLARILELVAEPKRLGVCLDTCHVFAAGYALAPAAEYRATLRAFDRVIGLKRLLAFHVNDSLKPQGSRVDRHAHIGQGHLGLEPFRLLVNDPRFRSRPMVLETPKENDMDAVNLKTLRGLVGPC